MEKMTDMKQKELQETEMEEVTGGVVIDVFHQQNRQNKDKKNKSNTHNENDAKSGW